MALRRCTLVAPITPRRDARLWEMHDYKRCTSMRWPSIGCIPCEMHAYEVASVRDAPIYLWTFDVPLVPHLLTPSSAAPEAHALTVSLGLGVSASGAQSRVPAKAWIVTFGNYANSEVCRSVIFIMAHNENGAAADDVVDAASAQGVKKTPMSAFEKPEEAPELSFLVSAFLWC
jgi:hypothetical protein